MLPRNIQRRLACSIKRVHDSTIEPRRPAFGFVLVVGAVGVMAQQAQRRPRRNNERHNQRKQHCRRCAYGDRPHVRPHQAADKGHRQNRGDDGEGRQDGGIADFIDGFNRNGARDRPPAVRRHAEVPHDVFHHDNGVIHQNADGEDQGEQRYPVQGVAEEVEDEQRQRQRHRNCDQHHSRLAPPQRQRNQQRHRQRGDEQMLQQLIRLVLCGLAVVAGDGDVQVRRQQISAQRLDLLLCCLRDLGGVGALALGQGNGYGRIVTANRILGSRTVGVENVILRFGRDRR